MKKIWIGLLVLLGVVVLAAAAFAYHMSSQEETEDEPAFHAMEASGLPLISAELNGTTVDVLHGYVEQPDLDASELPLIPVTNAILKLNVAQHGNTMSGLTYQVTEEGTGEVLGSGEFTDWENNSDTVSCSLSLGELVKSDQVRRLDLTLSLENGKTVCYYARVCDAEYTKASDLLEYVLTFHEDLFVWDRAKTHEANLERMSGYDEKTLADVNIHGTISQLSYGKLFPEKIPGTLSCTILQLDGSFGSFLLEFEVEAGEHKDKYLVKEYFCVNNGAQRIYLMDYRRTITEMMSGHDERFASGSIDFGIVDSQEVSFIASEDQASLGFTVADEVWVYHPLSQELVKVFTFRDEDDQARSGYRRHSVKILNVENNGDVNFVVYGYMNRGAHEGQVGVSCMTYQEKRRSLVENFFLPYGGNYEELQQGITRLAAMGEGGKVFLMVGDGVYSVDCETRVVTLLADQIIQRNLTVNLDQTAAAWDMDLGDRVNRRVQILYLDTGEGQIVEAPGGDWISSEGFIQDDCILSVGHTGESAEVNGEMIDPAYALVIQNREGSEETRYEYPSIYISAVEVRADQIEMERLVKNPDGSFADTKGDILMQSAGSADENPLKLTAVNDENRKRLYRLTGVGDPKGKVDIRVRTPKGINYEASEAFVMDRVPAMDGGDWFYAYAEGNFYGLYRTAGEAIAQVFDQMGVVMNASGKVVWRRTGRSTVVSLTLPEKLTGTGEAGRSACLTMLGQMAGQNGFLVSIPEGTGTLDAVETLLPGRSLNLTGAPVKALMYYVNKGQPVLVLGPDGSAKLMVGYDQYNVDFYDPAEGKKVKQGQEDTAKYLSEGCSCIGYVPN